MHRWYRPDVPKKETAFLKPCELLALFDFVRDHYLGRAIWIMGLAGLRWETIPPLIWDAINLEQAQIDIRAGFKYKIGEVRPQPKHRDWTKAPIVPMLHDFLLERQPNPYEESASKKLVCPNLKGEMLSYNTFEDALKRLCGKAGVRIISPHGLRHSCSELWVEAGASSTDVGRVLNHQNESTTKRYMHRTDDRLRLIGQTVGTLATRTTVLDKIK
ncbi:tyrosine-type recombinase/integrase [Bdellovibrionota bacterium FG-2]